MKAALLALLILTACDHKDSAAAARTAAAAERTAAAADETARIARHREASEEAAAILARAAAEGKRQGEISIRLIREQSDLVASILAGENIMYSFEPPEDMDETRHRLYLSCKERLVHLKIRLKENAAARAKLDAEFAAGATQP